MKVAVISLTFGNRPTDILIQNHLKAGYDYKGENVCVEGIANALNDGIDFMKYIGADAVAFLANDIIEPPGWLHKKVEALKSYPDAGVVASSIHEVETEIRPQLIIGNWLISKETIDKVGYFNESMFPYGPIDLDYCQRCAAAGIKTYYVKYCLALHQGSHATGNEYGWSKDEAVAKGYEKMYKEGDYFLNRK